MQRGSMLRAYTAIGEERYNDALARLSEAEKYEEPTPALRAEIVFLRARSYEGLNSLSDAAGLYHYIIDNFPESTFAYQAKERLKNIEN